MARLCWCKRLRSHRGHYFCPSEELTPVAICRQSRSSPKRDNFCSTGLLFSSAFLPDRRDQFQRLRERNGSCLCRPRTGKAEPISRNGNTFRGSADLASYVLRLLSVTRYRHGFKKMSEDDARCGH